LLDNPDLVSALQAYSEHLTASTKDLQKEIDILEGELQDYEKEGGGMDQIANRYAEITTKCERLRAEIQRLER
jgi:chromosome segregation ATPase